MSKRSATARAAAESERHRPRVCLVTGANRGIGLAVARALGALGPKTVVIVTCRKQEDVDATVKTLQSEKLSVFGHVLDVSSAESVKACAEWVTSSVGQLDVLVNNAGILVDANTRVFSFDEAAMAQSFDVNCVGLMRVTAAFVPLLKASADGRIVNVTSRAGQLTVYSEPSMPAYRISKTAANMATHLIAQELADTGIIVSAMCPGYIATDMTLKQVAEGYFTSTPSKTPADGAKTVVFLATAKGIPSGQFWADNELVDW
eukprot:a176578_62.p2 GENE.a176578_62~~a176578_62.p2  ORF type:complete len:297 (-),score=111.83 a176578_62:142-924(-)